jgi:uncharacterized phiE125 gp8 family phage protein
MQVNLVAAPAQEVVSRNEFAAHARVDPSLAAVPVQQDWMDSSVEAAREWAETFTGRQFITATWELWLDSFPRWEIRLPKAPLQQVVSVKYLDDQGVQQTLVEDTGAGGDYLVDAPAGPEAQRGGITPAYQKIWPVTRRQENAVKVQFKGGYGLTFAAVPFAIRRAIMVAAAEMWERREEQFEGRFFVPPQSATERLLWPYRSY